jgi:hypothetical protein
VCFEIVTHGVFEGSICTPTNTSVKRHKEICFTSEFSDYGKRWFSF